MCIEKTWGYFLSRGIEELQDMLSKKKKIPEYKQNAAIYIFSVSGC